MQVLPWALVRFCELLKGTPAQPETAILRLQQDLAGKQVALLFGLAPTSSKDKVELSFPKSLVHINWGDFVVLTPQTTFTVAGGPGADLRKSEVL